MFNYKLDPMDLTMVSTVKDTMVEFIKEMKQLNQLHENVDLTLSKLQELSKKLKSSSYDCVYHQNDNEFESNGYEFFGDFSAMYALYVEGSTYTLNVKLWWYKTVPEKTEFGFSYSLNRQDTLYIDKVYSNETNELFNKKNSYYFDKLLMYQALTKFYESEKSDSDYFKVIKEITELNKVIRTDYAQKIDDDIYPKQFEELKDLVDKLILINSLS